MDFKYACMHACIQILAQYIIWKGQNEIEKYLCENNIISVKRCQGTRVSTTILANINTNFSFFFFFWLNLLMEQQPLNEELFQITLWWLEFPIVPSKASFPCSHHDGSKFLKRKESEVWRKQKAAKKKQGREQAQVCSRQRRRRTALQFTGSGTAHHLHVYFLFSLSLSLSLSLTHTHTRSLMHLSIYLSITKLDTSIYIYVSQSLIRLSIYHKLDGSIYLSIYHKVWCIYLSIYLSHILMHR